MLKRYIIKRQNNLKGYYSGVTLNCTYIKREQSVKIIDFQIEYHEEEWKEFTLEGITLFYNFYKGYFPGVFKVNIKAIHWFPVDTRELLVTYTIIRVLCHWFQLDYLPILKQAKFESLFFLNEFDFRTDDETNFYI